MNAETIDQKLDLIYQNLQKLKKTERAKRDVGRIWSHIKIGSKLYFWAIATMGRAGLFKFIEGTGNILTEIMKITPKRSRVVVSKYRGY